MTQQDKILQYLRQHGEITVKEAVYELGITQLSTRIKELIADGHPIERREWRTVQRKDGRETQVRVYRLARRSLFPEQQRSRVYDE